MLGICYGMQWLTRALGGKVERAERREYGPAELNIGRDSKLFAGLPVQLKIWNSHGDHVSGLPEGFHITARTNNAVAAIENPAKQYYGVEFHPEVNHTDRGTEILNNFVFGICGARPDWNRAGFIAEMVESIRTRAAGSRAICALSGGVDSTVAAALVDKAIGDRLTNVFVDTGLLRRDEFDETLTLLRKRLGLNVIGVDASERFLSKLSGVTDPEQKRKIIRERVHHRVCRGTAQTFGQRARKAACKIPGTGDAVSGRDRIGFRKRALGGDQITPQRGRTAEKHAL